MTKVCSASEPCASCAGLEDKRTAEVLAGLRAEAAELAGEPVLGQLVASATDLLTRYNTPGEACAFCLERQVPGEDGAGAGPPQLLRLPCYHCFHLCGPRLVTSLQAANLRTSPSGLLLRSPACGAAPDLHNSPHCIMHLLSVSHAYLDCSHQLFALACLHRGVSSRCFEQQL